MNTGNEMNKNQLSAYFFNNIVLLTGLVNDYEKIKYIFLLGGLQFEPSNSQINNWRKVKLGTPIFQDEYMTCFINGLYLYKEEKNKEGICIFNFI